MKLDLNRIYLGDTLNILKKFPSESIDCVVTSPPYWGLRDYGVKGQIGLEKTPEKFIAKMVEVFSEVKRVLKVEGTIWVNIGDSYVGSWGNYSGENRGAGRQRQIVNGSKVPNPAYAGKEGWRPPTTEVVGLKSKDLVGIPWMLAFAMRTDGWYLRQDIIWAKPNPMPESVKDRCTKSHEYIFLMSKSQKYFFDADAIKTEAKDAADDLRRITGQLSVNKSAATGMVNGLRPRTRPSGWATGRDHSAVGWATEKNQGRKGKKTWDERKQDGEPMRYGEQSGTPALNEMSDGKANKRSVWNVPTMAFKEAHFATFPEELIAPMILAGCPQGGIVLDPFMGAGTTGLVAKKLQRNYVGIELNEEYLKMAEARIIKVGEPLFVTAQ